MQTLTIDIINNNALKLLYDLELLQLIRVRKEEPNSTSTVDWAVKFKGAMTKQPIEEIDNHLKNLRDEWE